MAEAGFAPIYTAGFFAGLWTQRNLLRDPSSTWAPNRRMDVLFDGGNVEISNNLTIRRAAGTYPYSSVLFNESVDGFYSFRQATPTQTSLSVMVDTPTAVSVLTPTAKTTVQTKSAGAGKTRFASVGNVLYLGNGKDQKVYQPSDPRFATAVRNWGISFSNSAMGSSASAYAGTAAVISESSGAAVIGADTTNNNALNGGTVATDWDKGSWLATQPGYGPWWTSYPNGAMTAPTYLFPGAGTEVQFTGFDFSAIPDGAVIDGVVVTITRGAANSNSSSFTPPIIQDFSVRLLPSGTDNKAKPANYPVVTNSPNSFSMGLETQVYGDVTDKWGFAGLSTADIKNPNFGVGFTLNTVFVDLGDTVAAGIFTVNITIYYEQAAPGNTWANPNNALGAPDGFFTIAPATAATSTKILRLTNYGFGLGSVKIVGIKVDITDFYLINSGDFGRMEVSLTQNGAIIGTTKIVSCTSQLTELITLGDSTDTWGTNNLSPSQVNDPTFGVQIIGRTNGDGAFWIDAAQITVYYVIVPSVTAGGGGTLSGTYKYVYEYVNTVSGHASAASPPSAAVTLSSQEADISLVASQDPQVNEIWVFRTTNGGANFYRLPQTYPNITQTVHDSTPDIDLVTSLQADLVGLNTPPPIGATNPAYHAQRMWVSVLNTVYYSSGPSLGTVYGNGNEGFPPANSFVFPSVVTRLVPTTAGLLVFTKGGLYIIRGNIDALEANVNPAGVVFFQDTLLPNISLLSYDALTINGSIIYLMTGDKQVIALDPSVGVSHIGFPISAPPSGYFQGEVSTLKDFDPSSSYLAWHVAGENQALYVADGNSGWFRCNTSQVPEGAFIWSPKRTLASQKISAIGDIETSDGVHQLLIGPGSGGGQVMALYEDQGAAITATSLTSNIATYTAVNSFVAGMRVNIYGCADNRYNIKDALILSATRTSFTLAVTSSNIASAAESGAVAVVSNSDAGVSYDAWARIGALVLAQPGTLAQVAFFTADFTRVGTSPVLSVLMEELKGTFENISGYVHADPPALYGDTLSPQSTYSNRYELMQTVDDNAGGLPAPGWCRYLSVEVDFGNRDKEANELLSLTVFGALYAEDNR